jgi:hypothetical protein
MMPSPCGGFSLTALMNRPRKSAGKGLEIADNRALLTAMLFPRPPMPPVRRGSAGHGHSGRTAATYRVRRVQAPAVK